MKIDKRHYWPIITLASLVSLMFVLSRYYKATIKRPSDPVVRDVVSPGQNCYPRTDNSGWQILDNSIQTYPRCLSVMNTRLGSRLNFNFMNGGASFNSSVLGTLEDNNVGFTLLVNGEPLVPNSINSTFNKTTSTIGLTYQEIKYDSTKSAIILRILSPFAPSLSYADPNTLMSHAPFLYLDFTYINKTSEIITPNITILMQNYQRSQSQDGYMTTEYSDSTRKDGLLSISFMASSQLQSMKWQGKGGYQWSPTLTPSGTASLSGVYAGYIAGPVLTDGADAQAYKPLVFAYTKWFSSIDEVNKYAFQHRSEFIQKTNEFEIRVKKQAKTPQEYWIASQAFHSYLGNAWLVKPQGDTNEFYYLVWEGEFKYINTVDVAHEYAILEGKFFPWVLKSSLDLWHRSAQRDAYGTVIPHDIGRRHDINMKQTYCTADMFPSAMPVEENANYLLLLYWYWHQTRDIKFVEQQAPFLMELFASMKARDTNNNGLADIVGTTTYDNDGNNALLKAPDNTYLGVKQLASYISLSKLFTQLKRTEPSQEVELEATKLKNTLTQYYQIHKSIPITLDSTFIESNQIGDNSSPMVLMGLLYPTVTKLESTLLDELKPIFASVYPAYRDDASVYDARNILIGRKLAKTQRLNLGWFSHAIATDYVASQRLGLSYDFPEYIFTNLYDNPYAYADGHSMNVLDLVTQTPLIFYPRGAVIFAGIE